LIRACLSYDFIGTLQDESNDDLGSLQVPGSWRASLDETFVQLLFNCYATLVSGNAAEKTTACTLECLSFVVSVRRSLFNEKERGAWVKSIMKNCILLLSSSVGLSVEENYHEFCKMLLRLKTNYNLGELAQQSDFDKWLELVAQFCVQGLTSWQVTISFLTRKNCTVLTKI
jgi:exportin-7